MAIRVGLLTIGQAPRADRLGVEVQETLGPGFQVIERGALDGLTRAQVAELAPAPGDYTLVTVLADGTPVRLGKTHLLDLLQAQIDRLEHEDGCEGTLLMCTGAFPSFRHGRPLLQPQEALYQSVIGLARGARVGALAPLPEQVEQTRRKWREHGAGEALVAAADPYGPDPEAAVASAAAWLRREGAGVLFMDCFGYDSRMKRAARAAFEGPVVLARSLAARLLAEVVA